MRKTTVILLSLLLGPHFAAFRANDPATLDMLRRIVAPQVVGVPPENASSGTREDEDEIVCKFSRNATRSIAFPA